MNRIKFFIRRHKSIAYLVLIQASAWLLAKFLVFLFPNTYFFAFNKISSQAPWSYLTFSVLSYPSFFFVLFDLMWFYTIGILLRDFRKDSFVWKTYFFGVYGAYIFFMGISYLFDFPLYAVYGAPLGNLAVLVATATLIPDFKLPLFFFGNVALKWLVAAYVVFSFISAGKYGIILVLVAGATGFFMVRFYHNPANISQQLKEISENIFASEKLSDEEKLDRILDKISKYGYNKLSKAEKNFLKRFSKKDQ